MRRVMIIAAIAALVWPATLAAHARAAVTGESIFLEGKLPTPVQVFCTDNTGMNYADLQGRAVYLGAETCGSLQNAEPSVEGNGFYSWAMYAQVLYHEWWHVALQETDEKLTDTGSLVMYRYMLRTYWGFTPKKAQAFYDSVVGHTNYAPLPYTGTTVDPVVAGLG
jgi:hypothetical protein